MQHQVYHRLLPCFIQKGRRIGQVMNQTHHALIPSYTAKLSYQVLGKTSTNQQRLEDNNVNIYNIDQCEALPHGKNPSYEVIWDEDNDDCTFQYTLNQKPYRPNTHIQKHFESLEFDNLVDCDAIHKKHSTNLLWNTNESAIETPFSHFVACECEYDDELCRVT
jgi:hypothetical protein